MTEKQFIKCPDCGKVQLVSAELRIFKCDSCLSHLFEDEVEPLKAISIQHPWAWLIVNGVKDIENRTWKTKFRGTVLIHAGKKIDKKGYEIVAQIFHAAGKIKELPTIGEFENWTGGICGHVDITDCVIESKSPWFTGPIGFTLENAQMTNITPCKGQLSFFTPKIIE